MLKLYLSPHHDDILLSLTGYLLDHQPVEANLVVVVFSDEDPLLERTCSRLHERLGLRLHLLGFKEALKRNVPVRSLLRPARTLRETLKDPLSGLIRQHLGELVRQYQPCTIYCPLFPVHIDHAIVRAAADNLGIPQQVYYEDQPYGLLFGSKPQEVQVGLIRQNQAYETSPDEIESFLRELSGVIPDTHLKRLVRHYRTAAHGAKHTLWLRHINGLPGRVLE